VDSQGIWVFLQVEVATDGGLVGHYWLAKEHFLPSIPPTGFELDYRALTGETVILDRLLYEPGSNQYRAYQEAWLSIGVGELSLWESAGWKKFPMTDDDVMNSDGRRGK